MNYHPTSQNLTSNSHQASPNDTDVTTSSATQTTNVKNVVLSAKRLSSRFWRALPQTFNPIFISGGFGFESPLVLKRTVS